MSATAVGAGIGIIALIALIIAFPLIIYHALIFPNVEGFFGDLDFYNADEQSQHFLYWFWFWSVAFGSGYLGATFVMGKNKK